MRHILFAAMEGGFDRHSSSSMADLVSTIRKPSKDRVVVFVVFVVLFVVLLALSIVFIVLYVEQKNVDDSRPTAARHQPKVCSSPDCVISSNGKSLLNHLHSRNTVIQI